MAARPSVADAYPSAPHRRVDGDRPATAAIAAVVVILQYAVLERLTLRITRSGGVGFAWSTLTMRIPDLQQYGAGDVIARRAALQRFAFQGGSLLPLALVNSLTAIVYVVMIFVLDSLMGVTAVLIVVVTLLLTRVTLKRRDALQRAFDTERVRARSTATVEFRSRLLTPSSQRCGTYWSGHTGRKGPGNAQIS